MGSSLPALAVVDARTARARALERIVEHRSTTTACMASREGASSVDGGSDERKDDETSTSSVTTEVRRLRRALHGRGRARTLRERAFAYDFILKERMGEDASVKRRLVQSKLRDCLRALETWRHRAGRLEVDLERALAGDEEAKSLQIIEDEVTRVLAEFEAYLEEREVLEDLPKSVTGGDVAVPGAANESRSTLELVRCVREDDEDVVEDAMHLDVVCERLRALETDDGWRGKLLAEVDGAAAAHGWSSENFAYGSTPFSSWIELFVRCPELKTRAQTLQRDGLAYVVFGSSAGWLVFYGALALGVPTSQGFEILRALHDTATSVRAEIDSKRNESMNIEFIHADMLSASLENVGLIVLTSLCWDDAVHDAACAKLAAELLPGAFVIDYGDKLAAFDAFSTVTDDPIRLPVSWGASQRFYVFKKVS